MNDIDSLNTEIEKHRAEIKRLCGEKIAVLRTRVLTCRHCNTSAQLSQWEFIQDHWYTAPHGCTGGDYWNSTETKCCHIVCPECNVMNYLYSHPDRANIEEARDKEGVSSEELFARVYDRYGRDGNPKLREKPRGGSDLY